MKLNAKILVIYILIGIALLIASGYYANSRLTEQRFDTIQQNYTTQLYQADFAISGFLQEVEYDVHGLLNNETVRTQDDTDFTQFLDADPTTFEYNIGNTEQSIIDLFNGIRLSHPYVNSVYMGRANGSFVRSHERAQPTQYDPRERPWYQLAEQNPNQIVRTEPYSSVTTTDINIGTVGSLVDENGQVYGVVGIDVTLTNLTEYVASIDVGNNSHVILLNENGIVLTYPDEAKLFQPYTETIGADNYREIETKSTGYIIFDEDSQANYLFYYTSPELGWKIGVVSPKTEVDHEVNSFVNEFLGLLALVLLLLSVLTSIGIHYIVVKPISSLQQSTEAIIQTHDLSHPIEIRANDEIGQLGKSINEMVASLKGAEEELRWHHQNLELAVKERTSELSALYAIHQNLVKTLELESVLPTIAQQVQVVLKADRCTIFLVNAKTEKLEVITSQGYEAERLYKSTHSIREEIVGQCYQQGTLQYVPDVYEVLSLPQRDAIRTVMAVPLSSPTGNAVGVLSVASLKVNAFSEQQQELITTLSGQIARGIENAQLYHAAQESDYLKSAFLASMSHELRTPLNSIIGFTGILLQGLVGPLSDEQRKQLTMVQGSARHLLALINDVLDISKIEAGELEIEEEAVDMQAAIERIIQIVLPMAEKKNLALHTEIDPAVTEVIGDQRRVEQVLLNLINNAIKFTDEGEVRVICAVEDNYVVTRIIDTGIGIKSEDLDNLFKPFRQIDTGLARQREGTGLGLSICHRLVQMMNGSISVTSEWGQGSTFAFTLPFEKD